ncbi:hypothetical protein WDL1P1_00312 (plasmid) [Variovorax sp. WDL1]|nr:hypothetical protein CHC06_05889 [Variovorax sp. B2]PNG51139.1 hypothetical protein CHC07_05795 [Variovorax sp. B4]VTU42573.1 hypothetical protein SRS16P1_00303 [Variovorax sp. SRS16]VTU42597.1 hypothetical protein E5P1_00301 [Variovorax sp. PBL-E5]VTU43921.1 hypothetical protein H6P1_00626 [Variovorax sp. PBL-H6]VTV17346.1 hypothetical protein WDL1P1_00312 [Variovorax sp. WDL1]
MFPVAETPSPAAPAEPAPTPEKEFRVGGEVSGLSGTLVLHNNGGDAISITANGSFQFPKTITAGNPYAVTVAAQPQGHLCSVSAGEGSVTAAVTAIRVVCAVSTFNVGGSLSGLSGTLVLRNNGGDELNLSSNGTFQFPTALAYGSAYAVTVRTLPTGQACTVALGSGTVQGTVGDVAISCANVPPPPAPNKPATPTVSYGVKSYILAWTPVSGATYYKLGQSTVTPSSLTLMADNLLSTTFSLLNLPLLEQVPTEFAVQACNASGCSPFSDSVTPVPSLAIGHFRAPVPAGNTNFGLSVAVSGDGSTLAVGSKFWVTNTGKVDIYSRVGSSQWKFEARVLADNNDPNDYFGASVALSEDGSTLAVGAEAEASSGTGTGADPNNDSLPGTGAAYVFKRSGATWSQQAYLKRSVAGYSSFGSAVSLSADGTRLAVAAPDESLGVATREGAVYVFEQSAGAWSQQTRLVASHPHFFAHFGHGLALSPDGSTLAIGEYAHPSIADGDETSNAGVISGAVHVYAANGSSWTRTSFLKSPTPALPTVFGITVALSGDGSVLAVGATNESSGWNSTTGFDGTAPPALNSGAVHTYRRAPGGAYALETTLKPAVTYANQGMGQSISLSYDGLLMAVGIVFDRSTATGINGSGPLDMVGGTTGAVQTFHHRTGLWKLEDFVKARPTALSGSVSGFGWAVSLSREGGTLAVGAPSETNVTSGINGVPTGPATAYSGAVYLY